MDNKTILRIDKSDRESWVIMDTRPLSDKRLSWKAKGLLAYLIGKPDDWKVIMGDLINRSTDGDSAVRSGLNELIECGYITRFQRRKDDGTFAPTEYIVRESPHGGFPHADNPRADNRIYTNDDVTNDEGTNNPPEKKSPDEELAKFGLTGEEWHKKFGTDPPKEEKRVKHKDPVSEVRESIKSWQERDKETPSLAVAKHYCNQTGINFDALPDKKRESIIRRFKIIIDNWGGASKDQAVLAWRRWREKYDWKEPNAFYDSFENEYGQILQSVKDGNIWDDNVMKGSV